MEKLEENRLVGVTMDSGSNIKTACEILSWACLGRNLNLAVNKALNDYRIQRTLRACRGTVAAFSCSWKKKRDLAIAQEQKNIPMH